MARVLWGVLWVKNCSSWCWEGQGVGRAACCHMAYTFVTSTVQFDAAEQLTQKLMQDEGTVWTHLVDEVALLKVPHPGGTIIPVVSGLAIQASWQPVSRGSTKGPTAQ